MTDEERFKVGITVNIFPPRCEQSQNSTKFPNLILLNDQNEIAAYENTDRDWDWKARACRRVSVRSD